MKKIISKKQEKACIKQLKKIAKIIILESTIKDAFIKGYKKGYENGWNDSKKI